MADCISKIDRYNDHRISEILPLNVTVETAASSTCFLFIGDVAMVSVDKHYLAIILSARVNIS